MSSLDARSLTGIVFGLFMVAIGVMQLFDPVRAEQAHDARLRHGESTDLRHGPTSERWLGFLFIGGGVLYALLHRSGDSQPTLQIAMGVMLLGGAIWGLLIQPRLQARHLRRYEAGLHANPPIVLGRRRLLLVNLTLLLFGGAFLALGLSMPR